MKEKVQIIEEALIPTPTKHNPKTDLVVIKQGKIYVVGVIVRHKDTGYL
jgi:predicted amidohydrolase YtcJ